jgi:hypothetical protein
VEITFLNEAIVVVAQVHNPSILHPSFLKAQQIVPEYWEPTEPPICTPPLSIVKYPEGIVFTAEVNKFQVLKSPPTVDLRESKLPEYVSKYVRMLPHVPYRAVGINLGAVIPSPTPEAMLIERFLRHGPWSSSPLTLAQLHLRFVYPLEGGVLNLSCGPGKSPESFLGGVASGVIVQGNYHFPVIGTDPTKQAEEFIWTFYDRCKHFKEVVLTIFGNDKQTNESGETLDCTGSAGIGQTPLFLRQSGLMN